MFFSRSIFSNISDYWYGDIDENYYKNVKVLVSNYLYRYQKISYLPENTIRIKSGVLDYINNDLDKYTTYLDGDYLFRFSI